MTHDDVVIIRTVSESRLGAGSVVRVSCNGRVWFLIRIRSVEDIFCAGGKVLGFGSGRRFLLCLYQEATAIPQGVLSDHQRKRVERGLCIGKFHIACRSYPYVRMRSLGGEPEYLRVWTQLSFAAQLQGGGSNSR